MASSRPRLARHVGALVGTSVILAGYATGQIGVNLASTATAYACMLCFAAALLWGPWRVLTGRPVSTNSYTRRDLGIWAAILGLSHLALGLEEAMSAAYVREFVDVATDPPVHAARRSLFRWGVRSGLVGGALLAGLLALSNDWSLRRLKPRWWKRLQRAAYPLFGVVVLHAWMYQILEARHAGLVILFAGLTLLVVIVQFLGFRTRRAS